MATENYRFKCIGYRSTNTGSVKEYVLEITDVRKEEVNIVALTPKQIASYASTRNILWDKNILYLSTKKGHENMLRNIFDKRLKIIS